jgi:rhomboid family GlyGly-CTERM serine protease
LPDSRREPAAALSLAVVFVLLGALAPHVNPWIEYERAAVGGGQAWRLVTAHLAHLGLAHGVLNAAAWILVWRLGRGVVPAGQWAWLLAGSAGAVDAGLYLFSPGVEWYVGASGMLHGAFAGMAWLASRGTAPQFGRILLGVLAAKLIWEQVAGGTVGAAILGDAVTITAAHLYGAAGGMLTAMALRAVRR